MHRHQWQVTVGSQEDNISRCSKVAQIGDITLKKFP